MAGATGMTMTAFLLIGLAVFISAFAQGCSGMGFAMLSAPIISLFAPTLIPVMLLVLMIPLNTYIGWRERRSVDWRGVKLISIGRFAGTFLGLWILLVVNLHQLALLIGWSTLVAAVVALLSPSFNLSRAGLAAVGLVTGVTETSTGVGGPPLALAYQHKKGAVLRSTVALCFLVGEVISLIVLAMAARSTPARSSCPPRCCPSWRWGPMPANSSIIAWTDRCCVTLCWGSPACRGSS
jgi:uncharacterized membrane protein YfcA